jgi:hypothetical protein
MRGAVITAWKDEGFGDEKNVPLNGNGGLEWSK